MSIVCFIIGLLLGATSALGIVLYMLIKSVEEEVQARVNEKINTLTK